MPSAKLIRTFALFVFACLRSAQVFAGDRPEVDLSVSVSMTPAVFSPGSTATVTMVVRNAGPDTAGAVLQGEPYIVVYEKGYDIVTQPPPFILPEESQGCTAYVEESEYIPGLPGGGITLLFTYWFGAIPPGESRTCRYSLQFLTTTVESFETHWTVRSSNDDDINPDNDRFDYTFVAAPHSANSVPALSSIALLILSAALVLARALASCVRPSR